VIIVTRAAVIQRLRAADRALLLCELSPNRSDEALTATRGVLLELERHHLVTMNPQTDRWRYCGPEIQP